MLLRLFLDLFLCLFVSSGLTRNVVVFTARCQCLSCLKHLELASRAALGNLLGALSRVLAWALKLVNELVKDEHVLLLQMDEELSDLSQFVCAQVQVREALRACKDLRKEVLLFNRLHVTKIRDEVLYLR